MGYNGKTYRVIDVTTVKNFTLATVGPKTSDLPALWVSLQQGIVNINIFAKAIGFSQI